jgi:hypothetical protein
MALLVSALAVLAMALAACSGVVASPSSNGSGGYNFITPDTSQYTATPTFPPFTIGIQVSDYSPQVNDNITFYVWCRVQDPTMINPPMPPSTPVNVTLILDGPIHATLHGTTDSDGIATIPYVVNDPYVGQPVDVTATAIYQGKSYIARAFFTSGVSTPPTPTATPTTAATAGPTPTSTP